MPAFCAAIGSFHAKSWVMYFVRVLTTVRVLPLLLTFTLIRSSTLTVSTFGVRSYSDQRYWSMQTSGSGHASRALELAAGLAAFCSGSVGLTATICIGGVAGCGIGRGSDKVELLPMSASSTEPVASFASFRTGSGVLSDAVRTDGVAGRRIGGGSDKATPSLPVSATLTEPVASLASFRSGSGVLNDAIPTGTAAGRGNRRGSEKAAPPLPVSATSTEPASSLASFRSASCSLNDAVPTATV